MTIKVRVTPRGQTLTLEQNRITVKRLIAILGLSIESAVVVRGEEPLLETDEIREGEEVTVVLVASGG
uniref:Thiamine biosynthesis protein ThiS n=1 Tax=Fervidicoccus fontis TaxID=683846 RepID=A0A7J3ZKV7_9CREN